MKKVAVFYRKLGLNVLPASLKRVSVPFLQYADIMPNERIFNSFPWKESNAIAGLSGLNDIACFDFDKCSFEHIPEILTELQLPLDYNWVVRSGSNTGFHIWFKLKRSTIPEDSIFREKHVINIYPKKTTFCHHAEIRLSHCYTILPPSEHSSGMFYSFYFEFPKAAPEEILFEDFFSFLNNNFTFNILLAPKETLATNNIQMTNHLHNKLISACEHIANNLEKGSYTKWITLGFALCSLGEAGYEYFKILSLKNKNYNDSEASVRKVYNQLLKDYNGSVAVGSLFYFARSVGWRPPDVQWWYKSGSKLKINRNMFINFLSDNNFSKISFITHYQWLYRDDHFLSFVQPFFIKDFVVNYINSLPEEIFNKESGISRNDLLDELIDRHIIFKPEVLEYLPTLEIEPLRDKKDAGYFFFKNCYLEITKEGTKELSYSTLKGYIYSEKVIKRDLGKNNDDSVFKQFCKNICNNDEKRYNALISSIGFLLHNYKDPALAKAIVFCDEVIGFGAQGRSGKSLIGKAISHVRKTLDLAGRNFSFSDKFCFQQITPGTDLVFFNDIEKRFPFHRLFNLITDTLFVERKNMAQINIPFSISPKILITTNFSILASDHSSNARQFSIEFSNHYNIKHTPMDEFKHRFFDDWNKEEWDAFYYFMADCLSFYLANGLCTYKQITINSRKVIDYSGQEFHDFMLENTAEGIPISKNEFLEKFKEFDSNFSDLKMYTFTKWLKNYAAVHDYEFKELRLGREKAPHFIFN